MAYKVSKSQFGALVESVLAELPPEFAKFLEEVPLEIMDRPAPRQMRELKVAPNHILLGLYRGRDRVHRSVEDSGALPDLIYIFQQPIESISNDQADLRRQIRTTVLHEIGHHFGMDEDDLKRLGYD